jgi:hypothetical protein
MANTAIIVAEKAGSSGFFSLIKYLFKFSFTYFFIIFLLINAIFIGVHEKSIVTPIKDLGNRFLLITNEINNLSLEIINNKGISYEGNTFFSNLWSFISTNINLLTNLWMFYLWIKLFTFLYGYSPFSNESNKFINIALALVTIFITQAIGILIFTVATVSTTKAQQLLIPFTAFYNLFNAFPYIFSSVNKIFEHKIELFPKNLINVSINNTAEKIITI